MDCWLPTILQISGLVRDIHMKAKKAGTGYFLWTSVRTCSVLFFGGFHEYIDKLNIGVLSNLPLASTDLVSAHEQSFLGSHNLGERRHERMDGDRTMARMHQNGASRYRV